MPGHKERRLLGGPFDGQIATGDGADVIELDEDPTMAYHRTWLPWPPQGDEPLESVYVWAERDWVPPAVALIRQAVEEARR
jgi:hypothetical protein